jgi:hypothetical protein
MLEVYEPLRYLRHNALPRKTLCLKDQLLKQQSIERLA